MPPPCLAFDVVRCVVDPVTRIPSGDLFGDLAVPTAPLPIPDCAVNGTSGDGGGGLVPLPPDSNITIDSPGGTITINQNGNLVHVDVGIVFTSTDNSVTITQTGNVVNITNAGGGGGGSTVCIPVITAIDWVLCTYTVKYIQVASVSDAPCP